MQNLTVADWARSVGISRQAAYEAVKRCRIPMADGMVDAEAATALYRARTRKSMNGGAVGASSDPRPGTDERVSYEEARRREAVANALMRERAEREQAGELVSAAAVRQVHGRRLAALREALLQVPARMAPVVAAETDERRVHDLLRDELHAVLAASVAGAGAEGAATCSEVKAA